MATIASVIKKVSEKKREGLRAHLSKKSPLTGGEITSERSAKIHMAKMEKAYDFLRGEISKVRDERYEHGSSDEAWDREQELREKQMMLWSLMEELEIMAQQRGWYVPSKTLKHARWRESVGNND